MGGGAKPEAKGIDRHARASAPDRLFGAERDFRGHGQRLRPWRAGGKLLGDSAAVTAMLDRLLHHGQVLNCRPRSWRTKTGLPEHLVAG